VIQPPIALIGAGGQLASDLAAEFGERVLALPHPRLEVTDADGIERELKGFDGVVVNTAGYNLVDQAEEDTEGAFRVNAFGVRNLARYCGKRGLRLVHFSTDYVLDADPADGRPLDEAEVPCPGGVYAASKLAGEHFVRAYCRDHLIVRTCGLYGMAATRAKGNFIETMLRLGQTRPEVAVVDDQYCTPSFTVDVAGATAALVEGGVMGTIHVTNAGFTTWRGLAEKVFELAGMNVRVRAITSAEFGAKARRPRWSVLDCSRLESVLGRSMPSWEDAVARYLQQRTVHA
jgi:dTDP-4-dehydrorhamnose reductase